jgi:arsenate reductase
MEKVKVLFVCIHNSARSQMAEAFLNKLGGDRFQAESAGLGPGPLNPLAVEVMREIGIDISQKKTKSVFDLYKQGRLFSHVVTVCEEADAQKCPIFPGFALPHHWSVRDPAQLPGTHAEQLSGTRIIRDEIEAKVKEFIAEFSKN